MSIADATVEQAEPGQKLAPRELDVLRRLVAGWTAKRIGTDMDISVRTVEKYRHRIRVKLGAENVHDLVRLAQASGMVEVSNVDPYKVLGLDRSATREDVTAAYRRAAKQAHPDVPGGSGERFNQVAVAGAVLRDPERRARYDETGDLGGEPDNTYAAAVGHVIEALDHILGQWVMGDGPDPTEGPVVRMMQRRIEERVEEIRERITTLTRGIDALTRVEKRLRPKRGQSPVQAGVSSHRGVIEAQRSSLQGQVRSYEQALEMLADCDYEQPPGAADQRSHPLRSREADFLDMMVRESLLRKRVFTP